MKILIVSKYFYPVQAIASKRITAFAKHLKEDFGAEVSLLTSHEDAGKDSPYLDEVFYISENNSLTSNFINYLVAKKKKSTSNKVVINAPAKNTTEVKSGLKQKIKSFLRNIFYGINFKGQLKTSKIQYRKFLRQEKKYDFSKYDVILSTYSPLYDHYIAKRIKKKNPNIIWVADFRDPIYSISIPKWYKNKCDRISKAISAKADIVQSATQDSVKELRICKSANFKVVYNGYENEVSNFNAIKNEKCTLIYAGSFYVGHSGFNATFKAIAELINEEKIDRNKFQIAYAGRQSQHMLNFITAAGLNDIFIDYGLLKKEDCDKAVLSSNVLLVTVWNEKKSHGILSGKFMEILPLGKPIIVEVNGKEPNSEIERVVKSTDVGFCFEEAQSEQKFSLLKQYILNIYNEFIENGHIATNANIKEIEKYNYKNIVKNMYETIMACKENYENKQAKN